MLLCTTIIENGLDVPNANTIIINQAQNIGLSDLHQLRGRVGRSNRRAFCYLMVPPLTSITEDARRRLKAIESFSDLGSGFNIAMQDLDIRGAGNLLGAEQSGFITDMGFETYQKILAEAMEELGVETGIVTKGKDEAFISDCTIETDQLALIPDSYIDMTAEKIRIYKELDSLTSDKEIEILKSRLSDTELLHKTVVTSAAANGTLRTDTLADELEYSTCVVVKSAYDMGVYLVFDTCRFKHFGKALHVAVALVTEMAY